MIDDIEPETEKWLIEGMVCPWLTILSGQPKHGKTIMAGHIALSLINNEPLLGKEVRPGTHRIGWMGYDGGWREELQSRLKAKAKNQIVTISPIRNLDENLWLTLGFELHKRGVTLFVLDHLYGMAGTLGLNDANNCAILENLLRPIYEQFKIPVLVLAQAGKNEFAKGRLAHSVALEGEARCLLRLYEKRAGGHRKLDISSNANGEEKLSIRLTPDRVEFKESKEKVIREVTGRDSFEPVKKLLESTKQFGEISSWADAGRRLTSLGYSTNDNAGRSMANRYREQGLIKKDAGRIVKGDSFLSLNT
jgi:hypothetical protein